MKALLIKKNRTIFAPNLKTDSKRHKLKDEWVSGLNQQFAKLPSG